ncbi:MAG: zinc-ribbon domain-containing protein [Myxococcaceae bacterium]|nr:zinc-ribbon domain-containing protein [Myxococcaceae bacterium]
MNFHCDNCQRRYSIADEKIRGRTVKVRCRNCNHLCTVQGPPAPNPAGGAGAVALAAEAPASSMGKTPWDDEATVAAPPLANKAEWFAMVKGKQTGPFDPRGLAELVRVGDLTLKSYLWRKGMAEWKRGSDIPELAVLFAGALPALASPAPAPALAPEALPFEVETSPQPPTASQVGKVMNLGELFSDADLPDPDPAPAALGDPGVADEPTRAPISSKPSSKPKAGVKKKKEEDPFAVLGDFDPANLPPPGEATRFFIAQAGVNKRNPWWKTVGFIVGGLAIVVGVFFGLASMNVVPLKVKTTDASGNVVEQSVFSGEGMSALGDLLLGRGKKTQEEAKRPAAHRTPSGTALAKSDANMPTVAAVDPKTHVPTKEELAALYGDTSKVDLAPKLRNGEEEKAKDTSSGALSPEQIARVVSQSQSAFQNCIEQALRKNPSLKVPRFYIVATVAPSGVVTAASIDRKDVDGSDLGDCLKARARRMTFARFAGDEVDIEIPLIVGTSM